MERNLWIDALRFLACLAVVCLHVAAPLLAPPIYRMAPAAWWTANVIVSLVAWCVPVFVLISGAVNLGNPRNVQAFAFLARRKAFFLRVAFWTAFYLLLRFVSEPATTLSTLLNSTIQGTPFYHLWFLYMLAGLYLATPLLCRLTATASRRTRILAATAILATASLCAGLRDLFQPAWQHTALTLFLPFLGYYLLGYEIANLRVTRFDRLAARLGTVVTLVLIALVARGLINSAQGQLMMSWHQGSFGPMVIALSLGVFMTARGIAPERLRRTAALAPPSFGVYVLHPLFIPVVAGIVDPLNLAPTLAIPLIALAVFAWSLITVLALLRIPYLRRLFA